MLRFDIVTLFPEMFAAVSGHGISRRALERGLWQMACWNPREWAENAYGSVDDRPFGGGPGMVLMPDPVVDSVEAVRRSVCIKAEVVGADEFETTGRRSALNYGHTLAHAIESTTGYSRFRHGEADGIGMMFAASLSVQMGLLDPVIVERQQRVLEKYGLPTSADGLDRERLMAAVALDKKVQSKKVRWVLLEGIGRPVLRDDVPASMVEAALDDVLR